MKSWMLTGLVAFAMLSGCLSDDGDEAMEPLGPESREVQGRLAAQQATPGSGDPQTHGEPRIEWGPVETGREGLQLPAYAVRHATIDNDFGGASVSDVALAVGAGDVQVRPSGDGGYHYEIEIRAYGLTEDLAEQELEEWTLQHEDELLPNGTLRLATRMVHDDDPLLPGLRLSFGGTSISLTAHLPTGPAHAVLAGTGSGDIAMQGLGGSRLTAATGSGDVSLQDLAALELSIDTGSGDIDGEHLEAGRFTASAGSGDITLAGLRADRVVLGTGSGDIQVDDVRAGALQAATSSGRLSLDAAAIGVVSADTGSGGVRLGGSFGDVSASASSGDIEATIEPMRSGTWAFGTGSGDVDVQVQGLSPGLGFDVSAETGSGEIRVDLPDLVMDGIGDEDHVRARTVGFDNRPVQVALHAGTSSGDITIAG